MCESTPDDKSNQDPSAEGRKERDKAHDLLKRYRAPFIRRMQHAAIEVAIRTGKVTADDWHRAVELPPDIDPRCCGAVPIVLAKAGVLKCCGFAAATRKDRHAGTNRVWKLKSKTKALKWLKDNPLLPDDPLPPPGAGKPPSLFGDDDLEGGAT